MPSANLSKDRAGGESDSDSSSMTLTDAWRSPSTWHFDIDFYLNRIIPAPRWSIVPYPVAHFLGHRKHDRVQRIGNVAMTFWAFVGIFCAILLIELAMRSLPVVEQSGLLIVASFVSPEQPTTDGVMLINVDTRGLQRCLSSIPLSHL